jgi:hypothetical protein
LKRLVHAHIFGDAHFAPSRVERDIYSTFILRQEIQRSMRVNFNAMSMRVHTSGDEKDAGL